MPYFLGTHPAIRRRAEVSYIFQHHIAVISMLFGQMNRFPDRTIDEADITARTPVLADYIETVLATHGLTRARIAIGFSNVRSWRQSWS